MAETYARPIERPREPTHRVIRVAGLSDCSDFWSPAAMSVRSRLSPCAGAVVPAGIFSTSHADRPRRGALCQATKQMVETGAFLDIRSRMTSVTRNRSRVLVAALAVAPLPRWACPRAQVRIWLNRNPSLVGAIGRGCFYLLAACHS